MRREAFERARAQRWAALERACAADGRASGARASSRDFPAHYRRVCQDLALARGRRYGAELEERLNQLALRGRDVLYARRGNPLARVRDFATTVFPRQVRALRGELALATALLGVPFVAFLAAAWLAPSAIEAVLDPDALQRFESMYDPSSVQQLHERDGGGDVEMFGFYVYNNVGIAFRLFAGGALFGLGTIFYLLFNGIHLGAAAGYLSAQGLGGTFWPFVIGHGAFELTGIVLAGQAGLHLGHALIAPGQRTRARALREAGRASATIVGGAALMLVCAAVLESSWSSSDMPSSIKCGVGGLLWLAVLGYLAFGGRARAT